MSNKYDDIIHLPHHVSAAHPPMAMSDRAAQFSPFAALTGYEAAIRETCRQTNEKAELSDDKKLMLNEQLNLIRSQISESPLITVTYFVPDIKKAGGSYETVTGTVKNINRHSNTIILHDQTVIPIDDIFQITSGL